MVEYPQTSVNATQLSEQMVHPVLGYLNVPDALDAGGVDVGVVGGGDAPRGLPPQDPAAAVHHPLQSGRGAEIIKCSLEYLVTGFPEVGLTQIWEDPLAAGSLW